MRMSSEPAGRPVTGPGVRWLIVALLAAGVLLVVLQQAAGPWLVALAGGLAVVVSLAGLAASRPLAGDDAALLRHVEAGWAALRSEITRSRRHDRSFAVVGIPDELWSAAADPKTAPAELALDVADSVQGFIRRSDRAWADGTLLHVLLTDCDRREGNAFLDRARAAMPQLFDDARVRMVVFPDDGITLGALMAGLGEDATTASVGIGEPTAAPDAATRDGAVTSKRVRDAGRAVR